MSVEGRVRRMEGEGWKEEGGVRRMEGGGWMEEANISI